MSDRKEIRLINRAIPRDEGGDPSFTSWMQITDTFEEWEIVKLVNTAIYAKEYQRVHHKVRGARIRAMEAPIKAAAKRLYPGVSWINLTEEQVGKAVESAHDAIINSPNA